MSADLTMTTRLLQMDNEGDVIRRRDWLGMLVDIQGIKTQILFSLPMVITSIAYYAIPTISVMFAGHFGQVELAGANLANTWATGTGFAFMIGLSGALETLCGQGFGAGMFNILGIHLQASCIVTFFFSTILSILWLFTKSMLVLLHQDPSISEQAAVYTKYLIPSLFAYGFIQCILRFFQTQSVVRPLILFSVVSLVIHIGVVYVLVRHTTLGFKGAPLGASISLWVSLISLGIYMMCSNKFKDTWRGFSLQSFQYVKVNLKLSIPSALMICFEFWTFESLVFMAGLMPNPEVTTSLLAMCVNTDSFAYVLASGLSAAVSTRVSNELGARNSIGAKKAMFVTIKLSLLVAFLCVLSLIFGHNAWAELFSNSSTIIKAFASMVPFLAVTMFLDCTQAVLSGVARGCGWQHLVMIVNLATFYLIGIPMAGVLGFKRKLYAKGLWIGLICGLFCQTTCLLLIALFRNWIQIYLPMQTDDASISESA